MGDKWDRKSGFCCSTCAYFAPKNYEFGRCRRNAPTMSGFPVVHPEHDFCGEHKIGSNPIKDEWNERREMVKNDQ